MGTAPPVRAWLLVEQPGPWGPQQVPDSALPAEVKAALIARAAGLHARLLLIRRPGRGAPGPRRVGYADSVAGTLRWTEFAAASDLLEIDPRAGVPDPLPLYLVCAHGNHDACCAILGRPVAAALAAARPGRVWECSHVGGDRYAGNVVVLPDGLYYGGVDAGSAPALADGHDRGEIDLARFRGASTLAAPAQAAQHFARQRAGDRSAASFPPRAVTRVGHEVWDVAFDGLVLRVRAVFHRSDTPLTCSAAVPAAIREFQLVEAPSARGGPAAAP
ncbi:sucrase ferredoxin [Actinokineospora guangxiensis]|uniref:Sucrase ferredoxin n=1 Tax=Actinokineospora guangxiensis TaxID=1490288 RepID=A0ABW0EUY4_9PSEU